MRYLLVSFHFRLSVFLIGAVIFGLGESKAQTSIGQSQVLTYSRNQYGAGAQNWALATDKNHRLFVANNEGLLVFNGKNWQLFPVPNKTILRSIAFGPGGKLFAGAQDELGFFHPDEVGRLKFSSLKALLPEADNKFPDVWQIVATRKDVFFRTNPVIYHYDGQQMVQHKSKSSWLCIRPYLGSVVAQEEQGGILFWKNGKWQSHIPQQELPEGLLMTDLVPFAPDTSLMSTEKHGLFFMVKNRLIPFGTRNPGFDEKQHFTVLAVLKDNTVLAGSYYNGLYRISASGRLLDNISNKNGLRNNTIRCLLAEPSGKVWMGLDHGLASYEFRNPIRHINPPAFQNGVGYSVEYFRNELYFALSTGIQYLPIENEADMASINQSPKNILNGLSWKVSALQDGLVAARDDGFWQIKAHKAISVSKSPGYWTFSTLPHKDSSIVAGHYLGIRFFDKKNGLYQLGRSLPGFIESSRYMELDSQNIWVSHPYRGVYRFGISGEQGFYNQANGLPQNLENHVFKVKGKILIASGKGIYEFISGENRMVKSGEYNPIFGDLPIRYLREDPEGNVWFVQDKMVGVVDFASGKPQLHYIPELTNKIVSGFENIFPYNQRNIFVGSDEGFYHLNFEKYKEKIQPFSVYLTQLKSIGDQDSILFGGFSDQNGEQEKRPAFPYKFRSLQFAFAASIFDQPANLEFSYFLEGFDNGWGAWTSRPDKDYTNLAPGTYTFRLKGRRSPSHESPEYAWTFTIEPPFYQTTWAWLFYAIAISGLLFFLLNFQARRYRKRLEIRRLADLRQYEEKQQQMAYAHQLELEKSEKEIFRMQKDKLETEIEHKNAELASATMNLVQKKEFILKLKSELQQLQKNNMVSDDQPELKKLLKTLSEEEKLNKEWDHFALHFDSVYGDFITNLKCRFPALKPHELQLCAYLRMNLSSKEIAPLMSISVRGVEIGRYRLRKKLALNTEENLAQFLLNISE